MEESTEVTRKPNLRLRRAREDRGWTQRQVAEEIQKRWPDAAVTEDDVRRWENGRRRPGPYYRYKLSQILGLSAVELGLREEEPGDSPSAEGLVVVDGQQAALILALHEWLTSALAGGKMTAKLDSSRRALIVEGAKQLLKLTSAAALLEPLGVEALKNALIPSNTPTEVNEDMLSQFSTLNEAAWQLSRGNHLDLAQRTLSTFLPQLRLFARQPSQHQETITYLATQGAKLSGILALHRNDLVEREKYCREAVQYSQQYGQLTDDYNLHVTALTNLADTYYYGNRPIEALQTFQNASQYIEQVSPLLQSRVYTGLGVSSAQCGLASDALTYLGTAYGRFPDHSEQDSQFCFAEMDFHQLILWEGLAKLHLGKPKDALGVFERITTSQSPTSERVRIEVINHAAHAAALMKDLERSRAYIIEGVTGAKTLNSQRRYSEISNVHKLVQVIWPHEAQVRDLQPHFVESM